ncbi:MAG TPA: hypothetical protein V6D22_22945 [Candidatus Obscuribacterales bacterium]
MKRGQHSPLIIAAIGIAWYTAAPAVWPEVDSADWPAVSKQIKELVQQYYPKAHVETSDRSVHFEYNVKEVTGYYGDAVVPLPGGILGDIELKGGDKPVVTSAQETKDGSASTTTLSVNPYSNKTQMHLVTRLTYPNKESKEFKERFAAIIDSFNNAAPAAPVTTTVQPASAVGAATSTAATSGAAPHSAADTAGPLLQERKLIVEMIAKVKELGDNVSNYVQVQKYIEDRIHAGATEAEVRPVAERLINELSDVCMGKIKDPMTLQRESTSSTSTTQPARTR